MDSAQAEPGETQQRAEETGELSDLELVAQVLRRDRKATAEFVTRCADSVYGYVRRRLVPRADLVDDFVQEIFLAAWESLPKYRGESPLRAWLLGIARHKVEDYYRKRLREVQLTAGEQDSPREDSTFPGVQEVIERSQAKRTTQEIIADLPEVYAVALLWRYWEKRSLREIALQTGKTEKAVERLLARARNQFKKKWDER
jgi:RNA polymerase sigma-70 factor, ECF subfamily